MPWKHFIPLWGQQPLDLVVVQERLGNISYPYGDSNRIVGGRGASDGKHFIPLWGQQHLRGRHGRHSGRNISYPYGDSNVFLVLAALLHVRGNISYPYGDSNLRGHTSAHSPPKHLIPLWGQQLEKLRQRRVAVSAKHFIPLWGQQLSVLRLDSVISKYFIPLWGQKENRYVQLDISVFTLSAIVIHMLRRPYRAPF